jgi:Na+-transporting NADH:ubiquinone oxidoreductase subunit D
MSESTASIAQAGEIKKNDGLFSKKNRKLLTDPLDDNNPITVQVLGICSALAVTSQIQPAVVMAISVIFVVAFSNLFISLMRNGIPSKIRMIVQLTVIAALVTVVDQVLHAFSFDIYKKLTVFVGLIITNCIIMGRLEAYAMANRPWKSFLDGIGNGLGYGGILILIAFIRELTGSGSLFGHQVIPQGLYEIGYVNNSLMISPYAAMFVIGVIIWVQRSKNKKLVDIS